MIELKNLIHHDGSERYIQQVSTNVFEVSLKVPSELKVERVLVRTVRDGEPVFLDTTKRFEDSFETYTCTLTIHNPRTNYRWFLGGGELKYGWLNQAGWQATDISDVNDFVLTPFKPIPYWARQSVVYQIFPDRFARSSRIYELPSWVIPRDWSQWPEGASENTSSEYFGGDFWGVIQRLDYLADLGINTLYFTPFFKAGSIHRYDAATFDEVDPLLGGNEALIELVKAAHQREMKVIGDITLNHSGETHEWFMKAKSREAPYRDFYTFDPSLPTGYECWLGVPSLPKFNYKSDELIERLISGSESVIKRWLRAPYNLDGWRVDVANMSGRLRELDLTHEIARITRRAIEEEGSEKILIAEHNHDACLDLNGDGWHGNMNYTGFRNPIWNWLIQDSMSTFRAAKHGNFAKFDGLETVNVIKEFSARQPFATYSASWNLLSSHDSARVRSIVGSHDLHRVAIALAMTMPGTPMIFAGDEIGEKGLWGEDSRSPFPWDRESEWDIELRELYKELILLRRSSNALAEGGLHWLSIAPEHLVFTRETNSERLLAIHTRSSATISLSLKDLEATKFELLSGLPPQLTGNSIEFNSPKPNFAVTRLT